MTDVKLIECGWKQISSWKEANNLIRRELKQKRAMQHSNPTGYVDLDFFLDIKPGAWYKFYLLSYSKRKALVLWRSPVHHESN